jgi:hypothetical protein
MPNDLTLQESKQGIKKDDLLLVNALVKSTRFTETALKLLAGNVTAH